MPEGIQIEVQEGFAYIEFLDVAKRGETLASVIAVGGPGLLDVDTSGTRKTYIVPESVAEQAGLLSPPKTAAKRSSKK